MSSRLPRFLSVQAWRPPASPCPEGINPDIWRCIVMLAYKGSDGKLYRYNNFGIWEPPADWQLIEEIEGVGVRGVYDVQEKRFEHP